MQARRSVPLSLVTLLLLPATPGWCQDRDRGPIVLDLPASTRALALGNAFSLGSRSPEAVFYHPGDLGQAQGMAGSLQRFGTHGTLSNLSAGQSWSRGGVVLGIQHLDYEVPAVAMGSLEGILSLSADEGSLRNPGERGASETVLSVGYGRAMLGARGGVVGKLVEQRLGARKASTLALDLGVSGSAGPVTMGLSVQNLGPALSMAGGDIPLPTRFTLGAASRAAPVGPLDLSLASALSYRLDGDLIPSIGLEVGYWPVTGRTFVGRVGYRYRSDGYTAHPVTFGGAFMGDSITLEYTYQGFESGNPSHRFGIGWR